MLKRERKALVTCREGPQQSSGARWVSAASPSKKYLSSLSYSCCLSPTVCFIPAIKPTTLKFSGWWHSLLVLPWTNQSRCRPLCSGQTRAIPQNLTQPHAERSPQEQPPAPPSHTLPNALAHGCAVAHLHQTLPGGNTAWSKPSFDTSGSHWKCQMMGRLLGWEREQQPKQSGEQLILGTHESWQKCFLGTSNKLDNTSTYSSSSSYFAKCCSSATNCSRWEMPRFNLQQEGCLTITQGSLWWSTLRQGSFNPLCSCTVVSD